MSELTEIVERHLNEFANEWTGFIWEGTNVKPLSAITLFSKIRKGSPFPDIPLVDTMQMIMSIRTEVVESGDNVTGTVGSSDWKFPIHEYGLGPPERPTLGPVFYSRSQDMITKIFEEFLETKKR